MVTWRSTPELHSHAARGNEKILRGNEKILRENEKILHDSAPNFAKLCG
jgi:hypothetical protein